MKQEDNKKYWYKMVLIQRTTWEMLNVLKEKTSLSFSSIIRRLLLKEITGMKQSIIDIQPKYTDFKYQLDEKKVRKRKKEYYWTKDEEVIEYLDYLRSNKYKISHYLNNLIKEDIKRRKQDEG